MTNKLSVVIITYNEEKNIGRCIDSVTSVADDIVVVDSFSTDRTKEICLERKVRLYEQKFEGYIEQKNYADSQALYPYILSLDADECLDEKLIRSITRVKQDFDADAYTMKRLSNYAGKWIRHGLWYPDVKLRLWDSRKGKWGGERVHEKIILQQGLIIKHLEGHILHYTMETVEAHIKQVEKYTDIASLEMYRKNKKAFMPWAFLKSVFTFIKGYIFKLGFLDGYMGLVLTYHSSRYVWLKYAKLKKALQDIMLRLVHLSTEKTWRGGEQQLAWLLEESVKAGVTNFVAVRKGTAFEKYCIDGNISHRSFAFSSQFDIISSLAFKNYCREVKADIVHTHSSSAHAAAVWSAVLGNKVPIVISRKVDFPISNNFLSSFKYNYAGIKRIICVSEKVRSILSSRIKNPERCTVIYDGVDVDRFYTGPTRNILRKEFDIAEDEWLIGNVAALAPQKDYFTFIKCAALLTKRIKARFVIIGEGELEEDLLEFAEQLGVANKIIFAGFRKDLAQVFHELDLFLFTSETEGLGSSLLDAMACRVPIVCTNAGGIPEIVNNEFNGLVAPVKDAEALAENVVKIYDSESLKEKLVVNASGFVPNFTKEKMAMQTVKLYNEIINSR